MRLYRLGRRLRRISVLLSSGIALALYPLTTSGATRPLPPDPNQSTGAASSISERIKAVRAALERHDALERQERSDKAPGWRLTQWFNFGNYSGKSATLPDNSKDNAKDRSWRNF